MIDFIDWDDAFDNSSYVADFPGLLRRWQREASSWRIESGKRAQLDLAYGAGERERVDIFSPERAASGLVVFIHGGYWQSTDKSYWSHLARGVLARGWACAIPSYPLAPEASLSAISQSLRAALLFLSERIAGPLRIAGHSAGGHLACRMLNEAMLPPPVLARLQRVMSISGIHQLVPLTATKMNEQLHLGLEQARLESPIMQPVVRSVPVSFWVGAEERPELLRQTRLAAEAWSLQGLSVRSCYASGEDHFSIVEALTRGDSALTSELLL